MKLYGLKTCDTCRKARKALDGAHMRYAFHDLREDRVTKKQLETWANAVGWEALLNTRSTTWRGLSDKDKQGVDKYKAVALLAAHPALIKRPVIETRGKVYVGWTEETLKALT